VVHLFAGRLLIPQAAFITMASLNTKDALVALDPL